MSSGGCRTGKSKPLRAAYRASSSRELDPVCRTQVSWSITSSQPAAGEERWATGLGGSVKQVADIIVRVLSVVSDIRAASRPLTPHGLPRTPKPFRDFSCRAGQ
jgi:hypothetical protein